MHTQLYAVGDAFARAMWGHGSLYSDTVTPYMCT